MKVGVIFSSVLQQCLCKILVQFAYFVVDGLSTYCDLAKDDTLFEGQGDYQFDVYRKMKEENGYVSGLATGYVSSLATGYVSGLATVSGLAHCGRIIITINMGSQIIFELIQIH
jgi:hypothetical protein